MARESEKATPLGAGAGPSQLSTRVNPEEFDLGNAPVKIVTGRQTTSNLNFDLKPGAIVAHERSRVIFVCG